MPTVYIVDDHSVVAEGLKAMFASLANINVTGIALTAQQCIDDFTCSPADIIFMDINLPDISGIDLCKKIKQAHPATHIIALSTFYEGRFIAEMIKNGASGYLFKNADKEEILLAIYTVTNGEIYLNEEAEKSYYKTTQSNEKKLLLTKREKEVLKLIVDGLSNTEIGKQLFISIDTVDTHRKNLYAKLNVKNIAGLIRYAIQNAII
jgi:DNA-binding NarL/FixJ family response regulator